MNNFTLLIELLSAMIAHPTVSFQNVVPNLSANYFADEFVNEEGGGQYFFKPSPCLVKTLDGQMLRTDRLRTSYIENKYLVLSPLREGAGQAYLDIEFENRCPKFDFSAALWSGKEGVLNQEFKVQYFENGWKDHVSIPLQNLPITKDYPKKYTVLFPRNTRRIRFFTTHSNPNGKRNKGRICLENIETMQDCAWFENAGANTKGEEVL